MENQKPKAIVVGAGIAGLQMASLLQDKGLDVVVLEAKDYIGGRIKEHSSFADFPIELGAEEVHGETSLHAGIAKKAGAELVDMSELSYFVEYQGKIYEEEELEKRNEWFSRVLQLDWEELVAYDQDKEDIKLSDYVKNNNFPQDLSHALHGIFASEWATDMETLSVKGIQKWNVEWDFGHKNFILKNMSNSQILKSEYGRVFDKVKTSTPVASITYESSQQVKVETKSGESYSADLVVIAVPLTQLKKGQIKFTPALPQVKQEAFQKVNMDPAMKVFLKFSKQFWNDYLGTLITAEIPRLTWASSAGGKSQKSHVLTGLVTGKVAAHLSSLPQKEAAMLLVQDLKRCYGSIVEESFEGWLIQDWTKEEYIEGGYTYPHINEKLSSTRKIIAQSVEGKLFFVGEHTSSKFSLLSGAMESSFIAFEEICKRFHLKAN